MSLHSWLFVVPKYLLFNQVFHSLTSPERLDRINLPVYCNQVHDRWKHLIIKPSDDFWASVTLYYPAVSDECRKDNRPQLIKWLLMMARWMTFDFYDTQHIICPLVHSSVVTSDVGVRYIESLFLNDCPQDVFILDSNLMNLMRAKWRIWLHWRNPGHDFNILCLCCILPILNISFQRFSTNWIGKTMDQKGFRFFILGIFVSVQ